MFKQYWLLELNRADLDSVIAAMEDYAKTQTWREDQEPPKVSITADGYRVDSVEELHEVSGGRIKELTLRVEALHVKLRPLWSSLYAIRQDDDHRAAYQRIDGVLSRCREDRLKGAVRVASLMVLSWVITYAIATLLVHVALPGDPKVLPTVGITLGVQVAWFYPFLQVQRRIDRSRPVVLLEPEPNFLRRHGTEISAIAAVIGAVAAIVAIFVQ